MPKIRRKCMPLSHSHSFRSSAGCLKTLGARTNLQVVSSCKIFKIIKVSHVTLLFFFVSGFGWHCFLSWLYCWSTHWRNVCKVGTNADWTLVCLSCPCCSSLVFCERRLCFSLLQRIPSKSKKTIHSFFSILFTKSDEKRRSNFLEVKQNYGEENLAFT